MSDDLYRLIPEEGKHLADSKDTEGAFRGVYLDDETNKPCGAGEFVKVDSDDPSESEDSESGADSSSASSLGLIAAGIMIGVALDAAYPHVKKWVVGSAVPKSKHLWRKLLRKEDHEDQTEDVELSKAVEVPKSADSKIMSMDVVLNDYRENMSSEDAQRELVEAFILYVVSAQKLSRVANANIVDTEGNIFDGNSLLNKMTDKQLLECVNSVIQSNPTLLNSQQMSTLSDILGYSLFREKDYIPITADALKKGLMGASDK